MSANEQGEPLRRFERDAVPILGKKFTTDQEPAKEHDPHFLAVLNDLFDERLRGEVVKHWFALSMLTMPVSPTQLKTVLSVTVWRESAASIGTLLIASEPVADFQHLADPEVLDNFLTQLLRQLDEGWHRQLKTLS